MFNFTIKQKITSVSVTAFLGFIIIFVINHLALSAMTTNTNSLQKDLYPALLAIKESKLYLGQMESTLNVSVTIADSDMLIEAKQFATKIENNLTLIEIDDPKLDGVNKLLDDFRLYQHSSIELASQFINGDVSIQILQGKALENNERLLKLKDTLNYLEKMTDEQLQNSVRNIEFKAVSTRWVTTFVSILWVLCLFIYSVLLGKNIINNIALITESLKSFSEGNADLTNRVSYKKNDELGELASSFDDFVVQLQSIISEVIAASISLEEISKELIASTKKSNEENNKQNESVQDSTAAVRELLTCVEYITESSTKASELAKIATFSAESGNTYAQTSVEYINNLSKDIKMTSNNVDQLKIQINNVNGILNTIQSIAEQTNLLALNAAIEAARAGEQGRGFAVVADEVRSLANRTHDSTLEIQNLLNELILSSNIVVNSMKNSADVTVKTVETSESSGQNLIEIKSIVNDMLMLNTQVTSAAEEQSATCKSIDNTINLVSELSENSLHHGAQLVDLGDSIKVTSNKMYNLVSRFTV